MINNFIKRLKRNYYLKEIIYLEDLIYSYSVIKSEINDKNKYNKLYNHIEYLTILENEYITKFIKNM